MLKKVFTKVAHGPMGWVFDYYKIGLIAGVAGFAATVGLNVAGMRQAPENTFESMLTVYHRDDEAGEAARRYAYISSLVAMAGDAALTFGMVGYGFARARRRAARLQISS